jgi:predicted PP-loop superfamily ATPase
MRVEMDALPERIEDQKRRIENCKKDIENAKNDKTDYNAIPYKEQKAMREKIYKALKGFENCPEEKFIMKYRGFDIVVPAYMVPRKRKNKQGEEFGEPIPYVMIKANGIYRIEIESESGISVRLNNFIASHVERDKETKKVKAVIKSGLEDRLETYQSVLETMETKLKNLGSELAKEGGFLKEIQAVQVKLAGIDEELGLDKEVA